MTAVAVRVAVAEISVAVAAGADAVGNGKRVAFDNAVGPGEGEPLRLLRAVGAVGTTAGITAVSPVFPDSTRMVGLLI